MCTKEERGGFRSDKKGKEISRKEGSSVPKPLKPGRGLSRGGGNSGK